MNRKRYQRDRYSFRLCLIVAAVLLFASFCPLFLCSSAVADDSIISFDSDDTDATLSVDPTARSDGYSIIIYDNTNGLPTSEANAIAQTSDGFIWIGCYSGLIRYDGNTFERIPSNSGISSVVSLCVDSRDRLWIGTNDSGAAVMENNEYRIFNKQDGLSSLYVSSIVEGDDGTIYLGTTSGVVAVNEDMELTPIDDPRISNDYVLELHKDNDGAVCGMFRDGAIFVIRDGVLTGYYDEEHTDIHDAHTVCPDPDNPGYYYIGTSGNAIYYGRMTDERFYCIDIMSVDPLSYIHSISIVDEMMWVCTDSGLGVVTEEGFQTVDNIPLTASIDTMMVDYIGNLWFTSSKRGVIEIVPNLFTDIFAKYDIDEEVVYSTCVYNDMLLIGTKSRGLIAISGGKIVDSIPITSSVSASGVVYERDKDLIKLFSGYRIRSIISDSLGRIWISTYGDQALVRYYDGEVVKFAEAEGLPSDRIRTVYECDNGDILVCCTGGLAVMRNDQVIRVYNEDDGLVNTEVLTACQNNAGELIVGTDGGGLYIISGDEVTHIGVDDGLSSDVIMRAKRDEERDLVWLVTSNAICYMTPDHEIHIVSDFPYSNNFDLYENSRGEMWVLSSNGIYVVNVDDLLSGGSFQSLFYGMDNGLPTIATPNSYSALLSNGDLFIPGNTGVAKVNIEETSENVSNLKAAIPYITADDEYIYPDSSGRFTIPSDTKRLTIYCYVFNYSLMNPTVTYRLAGFEDSYTVVKRSDLTPITYTNLSGGKYTFEMKVEDPHGMSSIELNVTIVKKKAFFELLWVRISCILLIIAAVAGAFLIYLRRRTRAFEKKEQEQKELIREIVEAFAKVIDMKDKYTNGHSTRVAEFTAMLTRELGYDDDTVEKYYNIALMHDIGKIGIPPEVLNKPGKLDENEYHIIQSHSSLGYETLKDISIMPELATGAGAHHERPDGKGYPKGLKGDEIPRVAQIIAVADTFDAMYSERPYRKRMNFEKVLSILKDARGTQLTADVVDAFLRLAERGEFRAVDDNGGGTTEDIDNIHKRLNKEEGSSDNN